MTNSATVIPADPADRFSMHWKNSASHATFPSPQHRNDAEDGTFISKGRILEEGTMPVFLIMWAIPTVIVLGSGAYLLWHFH